MNPRCFRLFSFSCSRRSPSVRFPLFFDCRVGRGRFELDSLASPRSFRASRRLHHAIRQRSRRSSPHLPNLPSTQLHGLPFLRCHRFCAPPRDAPRDLEPSLHPVQSQTRESAARSERIRAGKREFQRVCELQRGELAAKQLCAVAAIVGAVEWRIRCGVDAELRGNGESGAEGDDGSGGSEGATESIEEIDWEGEEEGEPRRRVGEGKRKRGSEERIEFADEWRGEGEREAEEAIERTTEAMEREIERIGEAVG